MSSGRYQSRLFNFVHQQIRRVSEQCDRALRHLQVSTTWGVQVLLYPLYLLFQSSEVAGKLHSSVQPNDTNSQPQTPPTADTPIQQVLLLVNDLSSEEPIANIPTTKTLPFFLSATWRFKFFSKNANSLVSTSASDLLPHSLKLPQTSASSCNRPLVRGIATQLSNRTLVLVTAQNEILDILTPQQQQKLQERIIGEVANYWHFFLPSSPPLVLFSAQALTFVDRTVAELESSRLAPVSEVAIALAHRSWELVELVKTQLAVSLSGKAQLNDTRYSPVAPDPIQTHTYRIQTLIWAAIDYFFGNRGKSKLRYTKPDSFLELPADLKLGRKRLYRPISKLPRSHLPSRVQAFSADVSPWLTFSELFGDPESKGKITFDSGLQMISPQSKQASGLAKRQKTIKGKAVAVSRRVLASESDQPSSQGTQIEPAPEWIETHATAMGYVNQPLEQLLKWLDHAMLGVEDLLVRVVRWVQQLWQGK